MRATSVGRDDAEAAYFALLRARDEVTALARYADFLAAERERIARWSAEAEALVAPVDARLRRAVAQTDKAVTQALKNRLAVIADESRRLPDRTAAAEAFVAECEAEVERLRGR